MFRGVKQHRGVLFSSIFVFLVSLCIIIANLTQVNEVGFTFGSESEALRVAKQTGCKNLYISWGEPSFPDKALAIDCTDKTHPFSIRYFYGETAVAKVLPDWQNSLNPENRLAIFGSDWFSIGPAESVQRLALSPYFTGPTEVLPTQTNFTAAELSVAICSNAVYSIIEETFKVASSNQKKLRIRGDLYKNYKKYIPNLKIWLTNFYKNLDEEAKFILTGSDELATRDTISLSDDSVKKLCGNTRP